MTMVAVLIIHSDASIAALPVWWISLLSFDCFWYTLWMELWILCFPCSARPISHCHFLCHTVPSAAPHCPSHGKRFVSVKMLFRKWTQSPPLGLTHSLFAHYNHILLAFISAFVRHFLRIFFISASAVSEHNTKYRAHTHARTESVAESKRSRRTGQCMNERIGKGHRLGSNLIHRANTNRQNATRNSCCTPN